MKNIILRNILIILLVLPLLSACFLRYSTQEFTNITIEGDEFAKELARLYKDFAHSETIDQDWKDAKYFAQKGIRAARGIEVDPEHPQDWKIADTLIPSLLEARRTLLNIILGNVIKEQPVLSAKAYFYYDCWLEELEEFQEQNITKCRDNFHETLDLVIGNSKDKGVQQGAEKPSDLPAQEPEIITTTKEDKPIISTGKIKQADLDKAPEDAQITNDEKEFLNINDRPDMEIPAREIKSFYLMFEQNSADITAKGQKKLQIVMEYLKDIENYEITSLGYTNKSEQSLSDDDLADQRAQAVAEFLISKGIDKESIEYYGFSQFGDDNNPQTDEQTSKNRRVEIYIK